MWSEVMQKKLVSEKAPHTRHEHQQQTTHKEDIVRIPAANLSFGKSSNMIHKSLTGLQQQWSCSHLLPDLSFISVTPEKEETGSKMLHVPLKSRSICRKKIPPKAEKKGEKIVKKQHPRNSHGFDPVEEANAQNYDFFRRQISTIQQVWERPENSSLNSIVCHVPRRPCCCSSWGV